LEKNGPTPAGIARIVSRTGHHGESRQNRHATSYVAGCLKKETRTKSHHYIAVTGMNANPAKTYRYFVANVKCKMHLLKGFIVRG
jgi:hypothetical protein